MRGMSKFTLFVRVRMCNTDEAPYHLNCTPPHFHIDKLKDRLTSSHEDLLMDQVNNQIKSV